MGKLGALLPLSCWLPLLAGAAPRRLLVLGASQGLSFLLTPLAHLLPLIRLLRLRLLVHCAVRLLPLLLVLPMLVGLQTALVSLVMPAPLLLYQLHQRY